MRLPKELFLVLCCLSGLSLMVFGLKYMGSRGAIDQAGCLWWIMVSVAVGMAASIAAILCEIRDVLLRQEQRERTMQRPPAPTYNPSVPPVRSTW